MGMTQQNQPGRADDPTLSDFYRDMNQHRNAEYTRIAGRYVVEYEHFGGGYRRNARGRVVVWEALKTSANGERCFAAPEIDGNRYEWDAVGELWAPHLNCEDAVSQITRGLDALRQWCEENPYR